MNKKPLSIRCTIFTNRVIAFTPEISRSMLKILGENLFMPVILPVPFTPAVNGGSWELISSDSYLSILFDQNKMDFVCDMQIKPTVMSEFDIKKFIDFCVDNIGKIKDLLNCNFIRIAYSPQYEIEDASITELAEQFFKNTKFHDKEMTNYSMSNTFIKEEKVLDIPVEMNFLTNWSVAARRYKSAALGIESVQNVVVCTFDINTSPRQRINYNMDAIIDFYEKVQSWDEELMKNYLGARE